MLTIPSLVTKDLGYCCLWSFFTLYRRTGVIATRLGVSRQAVQKYRKRYREGCYRCEQRDKCLLSKARSLGSSSEPSRQ